MDKIFRRSTQHSGTPKKKKDEKARTRNCCINFHVSQAEKELIEARIKMSGLSRQTFFIESCLYQSIFVRGNIKTFTEFEKTLEDLAHEREIEIDELELKLKESIISLIEILKERRSKYEKYEK